MASKKPAKVNAGTQKEKTTVLPGKAIKYFSLVNGVNPFICPTCNRSLFKGIIYEHDNKMFCKRTCIPNAE